MGARKGVKGQRGKQTIKSEKNGRNGFQLMGGNPPDNAGFIGREISLPD